MDSPVLHNHAQRGTFLGVCQKYWDEMEVEEGPTNADPPWRVPRGWVNPTDNSVDAVRTVDDGSRR